MKKKYTNEEITVLWQPELCSHSAQCFKGLSQVFDPRKRPWINLSGATTEQVIAQVKQCPSGALSYFLNADMENTTNHEATLPEAIDPEVSVEALPNGPLMVRGTVKITDKEGNVSIRQNNTAFCRCGHSANKPFCDGAHRKVGFEG